MHLPPSAKASSSFIPPMRAIQFADAETRVTYVFPAKQNEITIQEPMTLLADPNRGPYTRKAINSREAVVQGPFTLRQGGTGIVVRFPIYDGQKFLGLAIGVYDLPILIEEALDGLDLKKFSRALSQADAAPFWQSNPVLVQSQERLIRIADTDWRLSVGWRHRPQPPLLPRLSLWILGIGCIGSMLFLIRIHLRHEEQLESQVTARTRDLTQAHEALKESEEKYRLAMDATSDGIWDWDTATGQVFYNQNWAAILNETQVLPTYASWESRVHPRDKDRVLASIRSHLSGRTPSWKAEHRLKTRTGEWKWVLGRGRIVETDSHGAPRRMVGTMVDISDRKKAEVELRHQRRLFEIMFNTIPDAVVITDQHRRIRLANKSMVSLFGYRPDELEGQSTRRLYAVEQDYDRSGKTVFNKDSEAPEDLYITRYQTKDGNAFAGETFGAKLVDEDNQWVGNLGIIRDITERLDTEKRLQQAQKMESIGNLAGGIAHDFNNLLYPIIGMAELLMDDLDPDSPEHQNVREILNAGLRGSDLVKQILAFSRQSEHRFLPVLPQKIIQEVLRLSRATLPANIEIREEIQQDCGMIWADPSQVHQVIMNMITNAFHALEENGGAITVRLMEKHLNQGDLPESMLQEGRYACLTISDTGHGIPAEVMDRIFDPYFTTKEQGKGTGLGLAVAYGIIKEHKGDIKVYSEPGTGTSFTIYLPMVETPDEIRPGEPPAPAAGGSERLLVVDDEEAIQRLVKNMLERLGYEVTACSGSLDALARFTAAPHVFDLVVTDMSMPQMTGDVLASKVKGLRPDIPVIVCTGFSEKLNPDNTLPQVDGILMKPIIRSELAAMVRSALDQTRTPSQA